MTPSPCELTKGIVTTAAGSFIGLFLNHGVLALGSILHHVPTANPHRWLLWCMRIIILTSTINSWLEVDVLIEAVAKVEHLDLNKSCANATSFLW